jgi:hypothetical protein
MALTRPKIWDIDTTQIAFNDPLTVLHQGATSANIDVGFLFNRANGLVSNVALYWSEANQSFIYAFTGNSGVSTDINVAVTSLASVTTGSLYTNGLFYASNSQPYTGAVTTYQQVVGSINPSIYTAFVLANTAPTLIDTLPYSGNVMVSWAITSKDNVNNRFARTTIDSINDGAGNIYYTQYGTIKSNNSFNVATFTSNISGANINLYAVGDSSSVNISFERHVLGNTTPTGYINNYGPAGTIASTTGIIATSNATAATSTSTGALQIPNGGAGIGGNLYVGGNIYQNNTIPISITNVLTHGNDPNFQLSAQNGANSNATGAEVARFGINYAGVGWDTFTQYIRGSSSQNGYQTLWAGNTYVATVGSTQVNVVPATSSTSTTTGALVIAGGAGIGGNVYTGGNIVAGNIVTTGTYGNITGANVISANTITTSTIYVTSNATSGTTTRVEYNIPHPFMLMGAA